MSLREKIQKTHDQLHTMKARESFDLYDEGIIDDALDLIDELIYKVDGLESELNATLDILIDGVHRAKQIDDYVRLNFPARYKKNPF